MTHSYTNESKLAKQAQAPYCTCKQPHAVIVSRKHGDMCACGKLIVPKTSNQHNQHTQATLVRHNSRAPWVELTSVDDTKAMIRRLVNKSKLGEFTLTPVNLLTRAVLRAQGMDMRECGLVLTGQASSYREDFPASDVSYILTNTRGALLLSVHNKSPDHISNGGEPLLQWHNSAFRFKPS